MQKAQPGKAWYDEREIFGNCKTIVAEPSRKPDNSFREGDNKEPDMATVACSVSIKWVTSHLMTAIDSRGTPLVIGTWPEKQPQWTGLKASDLLLLAAASCATWDVTNILNKQRAALESLEVCCTGEQESDPPYKFTHIHLYYMFKGALKPEKVARAIQLSEDKYCSVTNTLKQAVTITSDFEIL